MIGVPERCKSFFDAIFRFGNNKNKQCCSSSKHQKQTDSKLNSPTKKSADTKRKKLIQRNYSTKSLMGGLTFGRQEMKNMQPPSINSKLLICNISG